MTAVRHVSVSQPSVLKSPDKKPETALPYVPITPQKAFKAFETFLLKPIRDQHVVDDLVQFRMLLQNRHVLSSLQAYLDTISPDILKIIPTAYLQRLEKGLSNIKGETTLDTYFPSALVASAFEVYYRYLKNPTPQLKAYEQRKYFFQSARYLMNAFETIGQEIQKPKPNEKIILLQNLNIARYWPLYVEYYADFLKVFPTLPSSKSEEEQHIVIGHLEFTENQYHKLVFLTPRDIDSIALEDFGFHESLMVKNRRAAVWDGFQRDLLRAEPRYRFAVDMLGVLKEDICEFSEKINGTLSAQKLRKELYFNDSHTSENIFTALKDYALAFAELLEPLPAKKLKKETLTLFKHIEKADFPKEQLAPAFKMLEESISQAKAEKFRQQLKHLVKRDGGKNVGCQKDSDDTLMYDRLVYTAVETERQLFWKKIPEQITLDSTQEALKPILEKNKSPVLFKQTSEHEVILRNIQIDLFITQLVSKKTLPIFTQDAEELKEYRKQLKHLAKLAACHHNQSITEYKKYLDQINFALKTQLQNKDPNEALSELHLEPLSPALKKLFKQIYQRFDHHARVHKPHYEMMLMELDKKTH